MSISPRLIQAVCGIVLLVFAVVIVGLGLIAMSEGGYQAERYAGRFDPFRAGVLVMILPGCALAGLYLATTIVQWRVRPDRASLAQILFALGCFIAAVALVAVVLAFPTAPGPWGVPTPIAVVLFVGIGLAMAGRVPAAAVGLRNAIRRRDRGLLVVVGLLVLWVVIGILRRL